jgi:predicted DNA-binding transcriptional regulator AlpA
MAPRQSSAEPKYVTRGALCSRWGVSRAWTYKMQQQGYLPLPVKLGPGVARWPLSEIEAIEAIASGDRAAAPIVGGAGGAR